MGQKKHRSITDGPTTDELECLVWWPAGSKGEKEESQLVATLVNLMKKHGFGAVPQLCKQIEDIWRNPEKVEHYQTLKEEHFKAIGQPLPKKKRLLS